MSRVPHRFVLTLAILLAGGLHPAIAQIDVDPGPGPVPPPLPLPDPDPDPDPDPPRPPVVYFNHAVDGDVDLWRVTPATVTAEDPDGDAAPVPGVNSPARDYAAAVSPDGGRLAFVSDRDGDDEIFLADLHAPDAAPQQLTFDRASDRSPTWSPEGRSIAYVASTASKPATRKVHVRSLDDGSVRVLEGPTGAHFGPAWSPDGSALALAVGGSTDADLFVVEASSGAVRHRLTNDGSGVVNWQPDWSPDGRLVFSRRTMGRGRSPGEIRLMAAHPDDPASATTLFVSGEGDAEQADWSTDGTSVAFSGVSRTVRQLYQLDVVGLSAAGSPRRLLSTGGFDTQPEWARLLG